MWTRGRVLAVLAVLLAALLVFHRYIPNAVGNLGSLAETVLPWFGVFIVVLAVCAVVRRSATAGVALLLPAIAWLSLFGGLLVPGKGGGSSDLTVVTHNVNASNPNPAATARDLLAAHAGLVALEEVPSEKLAAYQGVLDGAYPYRAARGTVALFSKYPIESVTPVNIDIGWTRALRAQVRGPHGHRLAVYVAHLASVRVDRSGFTADERDRTIAALGDALAAEKLSRVILMGDLNGTANDRSLAPVTAHLRSAQGAAGFGFGFSWPRGFPVARIDHILVRGVTPVHAWTLPATTSDHLPVAAALDV
ncbi:hypothetical protein BIV57_17170 [Mangrovactinospora gilvigrisea]|uniref:Endonuclease/exonuclease/phosphatase domain-containing protein n=2 Tax=Mangrovactinospora gilvigrisea TaxID=1428644 RepID=A0A1J7BCF2_9ACTN|nr:endonuclease/exonuclease/phosphatase family protein [Mangrovactinospora gilvigrisea]OIV36269.1 hypothetical protein BIV57_17170 [Mangrovactinospora gilvigrisea]